MVNNFFLRIRITFILLLALSIQSQPVFGQQTKKKHHPILEKTDTLTAPTFRFHTVIIDAGHGGKDPGAHGAYAKEKNVALAIARKLRDALKEQIPSLHIVMTRSTDDFVELHRRDEIAAENKGDLFISIHCNSSPQKVSTDHGVLLLVYGYHRKEEQLEAIRENSSVYLEKDYQKKYSGYGANDAVNTIILSAFQQKFRKQCIHFADLVNKEFKNNDGRNSLGVREQGVLVLQQSAMPAVLVETGYINNPKDEAYLTSPEGQDEIAQSITRAVKKYKKELEAQP